MQTVMKYDKAIDIKSYLSAIPSERVKSIERVMQLFKDHAPLVEETFQYGMPYYPLNGKPLFAVASQKHFMAVYITEHDLVSKFKEVLGKVSLGKSCIRFKKEDHVDWIALEQLVQESYQRRLEDLSV